jgi:hypothetical protein
MFEDIIVQLDQLGVQYTEDYDTGVLSVDVAAMDKLALIQVIRMANDSGLDFTIDETSLIIQAGVEPVAEFEEEPEEDLATMQAGAMDQLF